MQEKCNLMVIRCPSFVFFPWYNGGKLIWYKRVKA